jgi:hypothetical protein
MNTLFELLSVPCVLLLALRAEPRPAPALRAAVRRLTRLADRRWLAVLLVGLSGTLGSVATTLVFGGPEPNFQDEYSYLLMADTFAHGRLTNPPHPLWQHFETFQVIHQPTYQSKYPVAQGLVLTAGRLLTGQPLVGVWLSMGLACAALCWMLQGWFPPRWALFGAALMTVRLVCSNRAATIGDLTTWGYWGRSYFGGAVAALGGALLYGALPRLLRAPRVSHALAMGVGLALLANSRPFEGLVVSLPAAAVLLAWFVGKRRPPLAVALGRVVLPLGLVLTLTAAAMALYNQRVTGSPLTMPYQVHEQTYAANPLFAWQAPRPTPEYRHPIMARFWTGWVLGLYHSHRRPDELARLAVVKWTQVLLAYFGVWLLIGVLALGPAPRDGRVRLAAAGCGLLLLAQTQLYCFAPHYAAPATGLMAALAVAGLRRLRLWRWQGRPSGRVLVRGLAFGYPLLAVLSVAAEPPIPADSTHLQRARLLRQLERDGDRHLIVVRYLNPKPNGLGHEDWVWNEADIDASRVVWAREMGTAEDRRLLDYYPDRRAWLLEVEVDRQTYRLTPHPLRPGAPHSDLSSQGAP